jgi:hypothetical protein
MGLWPVVEPMTPVHPRKQRPLGGLLGEPQEHRSGVDPFAQLSQRAVPGEPELRLLNGTSGVRGAVTRIHLEHYVAKSATCHVDSAKAAVDAASHEVPVRRSSSGSGVR